ncbi:MAG: HAMP domain-containing histidine kinase [Candidatus Marinimicrobia bacterium]|nr:HAMP domain-containing histidine kinase [Candidatus Neomarinimicrobiota bacterium]
MPNGEQIIFPFYTLGSFKERIKWLINIRWLAVFAILAIVPLNNIIFKANLGYPQTYIIASVLMLLNIIYYYIYEYYYFEHFRQEVIFMEIQLLIDLTIISLFIHFIGGINNPFYFIYLIPMIISGILLKAPLPYINALFACLLLTLWSFLEFYGIVKIYFIQASEFHISILWTSLISFYFLSFTLTYIINDFISKYRDLKKLIDKKSELLEQTIDERNRMFRFTAHEIKSPMNTIRTMLGIVKMLYQKDKGDEEKIMEMIDRAETRSDQVLRIVKDMIEIAHYKAGQEEEKFTTRSLSDWVGEQIEDYCHYAERKNIQINYISDKTYDELYFDFDSLEKIFTNLLSNAIRYSHENGKVEIRLSIDEDNFYLSVKDNGIGIKAEDKQKIFEEFYRSPEAKEKEYIGTGLGLPLVKQIVNKFNGSIEVESEPEQGTEFKVTIPIPEKSKPANQR